MAINNFGLLQPNQPLTKTDKLLADIQNFNNTVIPNLPPLVTPPVNVPKYTKFGDNLATLGGFGDQPGELLTQNELLKMNQDQIDAYNKTRKKARTQGIAELLMRFGDALQGKNATELAYGRQVARDQEQAKAAYQKAIQIAEASGDLQKANLLRSLGFPGYQKLQYEKAISKFDVGTDNTTLERFGVYNIDGTYAGTVNKGDSKRINEINNNPNLVIGTLGSPKKSTTTSPGTMLQIVDGNNNDSFVGNISANDFAVNGFKKYEDAGIDTSQFKLTGLPSGTEPASTSGDSDYDALKGRFMATNRLVTNLSGLAQQYYDNPKSALAIGGATQFVDSVIQNIDAAGDMLDGEGYKNVVDSGYTTIEGNDFSSQLKQVSQATGVSESRVRDLAYLFAAARGQEGRGLSDKDYENALKIVSGGVGAEGKIKVLEDVAGRLSQEVQGDLDFIVRTLPKEKNIDKYTRLKGSLPVFVNPYSINMTPLNNTNNDAKVKELLRKYGG